MKHSDAILITASKNEDVVRMGPNTLGGIGTRLLSDAILITPCTHGKGAYGAYIKGLMGFKQD